MMIFQCNVLCLWRELLRSPHRDAWLIVIVHFANKMWCFDTNWKYSVDLSEESDERDNITQSLQKSNAFSFGGTEGNFSL